MLRLATTLLASLLITAGAMPQNPPDQSHMPGKMGQRPNMAATHDQMMKGMQADLDSMRSKLQKMKDQLKKISDQSTKDQLELNIGMWQTLIEDMDKHMSMMKQMMEQGMMMHQSQPPMQKK